jgi:hypothetical protein
MLGKALLSASVSASAAPAVYVEDVFSTYLYTGNGSTQTITNDIDLAGEGGLVWIKERTSTSSHILSDTLRGVNKFLQTNLNAAESTADTVTAFNSNGFNAGGSGATGEAGQNYASWTFRKAPRFFDVVTYAGNGVSGRAIPHNLGTDVGMIIVKWYDGSQNWAVWHRTLTAGKFLILNGTNAENTNSTIFTTTAPTSTEFYVGSDYASNGTGANYVAYLFAHDPLGPSGDGSDGLISCGSVSGFGTVVNLGWEPQWILMKQTGSGTSDWILADTMRGIPTGSQDALLFANTTDAETSANDWIDLTSTGFVNNVGSANFIYIAIRRGPMRAPTSGTEVFSPVTKSADNTFTSTGHVVDLLIESKRTSPDTTYQHLTLDRLRGINALTTFSTAAEYAGVVAPWFSSNTGFNATNLYAPTAGDYLFWAFRRAPGFFDVVAYTGNGVAGRTVPHNLGVTPELMIVKTRSNISNWAIYHSASGPTKYLQLPGTQQANTSSQRWNDTSPAADVFTVGNDQDVNTSGWTYIAYLFATLAGVSKVGSYTGTGTTLSIDCGFTAGARFVLIKRTDSTGDWYVWDTARGIVSGDDPYLLLNSAAAEVTNTDYIDPLSSGFQISSTAPAAINASGGSFIFLAIA